MSAPDLTEPIVGYRAWHVTPDGELVPWSAGRAGAWVRGVNTARCLLKPRLRGHVAPMRRCTCGLYALSNARDQRLHANGQVVGAIVAWGEIEVHSTGFRAQSALIVALGLPDGSQGAPPERLRRAAVRYGVPLVPMPALPAAAAEYGRSVDWECIPVAEPRRVPDAAPPALGDVGAVGVAPNHHLELEVVPHGVRLTFSAELAREVRGRPFVVPDEGTEIRLDDVIVQAESDRGPLSLSTPFSGQVISVADAHHPARRLLELAPTAWHDEVRAVAWSPGARRQYAAEVAYARQRRDPFLERRTRWLHAHGDVRSAAQVLATLQALRQAPRFASEEAVYAQVADRLRAALADQTILRQVRRLPIRISWRLHEPDADILLDLTGTAPMVAVGATGPADLVVFASVDAIDRYFAGRLDLVAALRRREIQCSAPIAEVLRVESVLKAVKPAYAGQVRSGEAWASGPSRAGAGGHAGRSSE